MLPKWLSLFPPWLLVGLGVGGGLSALFAAVFVVGERLFSGAPKADPQRVDGERRRRSEIRDYLDAIDEPFAEDHPVHGRVVAFYLPSRDVAITFDAKAFFHIQRMGTDAILCEHEMPGRQLGRRLPFEVPEIVTPNPGDPVIEAFEHLGLSTAADADEVKTAYRDRVKEIHPDHGGDRKEFERVREAYTTAKDYAK